MIITMIRTIIQMMFVHTAMYLMVVVQKKVTSFGAHSAYNNGKQTCMLYSSHNFTI